MRQKISVTNGKEQFLTNENKCKHGNKPGTKVIPLQLSRLSKTTIKLSDHSLYDVNPYIVRNG